MREVEESMQLTELNKKVGITLETLERKVQSDDGMEPFEEQN